MFRVLRHPFFVSVPCPPSWPAPLSHSFTYPMGCGLSKSDATGVTIRPAGRHLLFVRRIEEIRRRRTSRKLKDTTPSRKTLLVHVGGEDDENVSNHQTMTKNARKSLSSLEDTESCVTSEGSKGEANKATEASSGKDGSSRTKGRDGEREKKTVYVAKDEVKVEEGVDGDTEDEGEDDDKRMISHREGEENFPGSPSFRVYFLNNLKEGGDGDGKDNGFNISSQSEDAAFPEVSEIKKVKKGRKGRSFKRGKNLLNVWSCQSVQV